MSITFLKDEPIWEEKYRPQTIDECILRKDVEKEFKSFVEKGQIGNGRLVLHGRPGTSKTTTSIALCKSLNLDWDFVNASSERGIDMIRDRLERFASTASLSGNGKAFIIDECDRLTAHAMDALKSMSEQYGKYCSLIMTANHPNRLTDAIRSRFTYIDFNPTKDDEAYMQLKLFNRVKAILDNENVTYDERVIVLLIQKHFPDNRQIVRLLQYYSSHGHIDEGVLMMVDEASIDFLVDAMKDKKFKKVVEWTENNSDNDTSSVYEALYSSLRASVDKNCIPDMISIINDYQRYDDVVPSKTLHIVAMATELMSTVTFK